MSNRSLLPVMVVALLCSVVPARSQDLPDGNGKETVKALCGSCHDVNRVRSGYTPEGWRTVMRMMVNLGIPVPADQMATVTEYLTKNFPERPKPAAVVIPGPVQVSIKEWTVPTPGSRPHDPLATRDGALWYTGQMTNVLGRLDPKSGQFKDYPLKTPHSGPHGLTEDRNGNIWFTGNHASLIGKLDPKTGAVTEYKMPDPAARDPHTLVFDQSGILWFSVQQGNMVGRLDPKTGDVKLLTMPAPKSRPYGMAVNSTGMVFVVEFGANRVAASIRKRCRSVNSPCRMRAPVPDVSPSPATTSSGIRTSRAAISAGSILPPAKSPSGHLPAGPSPSPTPWPPRRTSSGTAKPERSRIQSYASTRRRRNSRPG